MKPSRTRIAAVFTMTLAILFSLSCATGPGGYAFSNPPDEYKTLGLSEKEIATWEDGMRTTGEKGNYEWWYFDSTLDDGSTLVIVFYSKIMLEVNKDLDPVVSVKLTDPDGTVRINTTYKGNPASFSASTETCDVRIGPNRFSGDLKNYVIELNMDDIQAEIRLTGTVSSWRPGTGHSYFKDDEGTSYFAWLPAVPRGIVEGKVVIGGEEISIHGSGYHDHNWGNASIIKQMHDWYWGRAEVGSFTVITSFITVSDYYGGGQGSTFVLFRDDELLAEDGKYVTCSLEDVYIDKKTGKPVANIIIYDCNDGKNHYRVSYFREKDIEAAKFADAIGGIKGFFAKLIGFDGAYLRFTGKVIIEIFDGEDIIETAEQDSSVWELMYLGKVPQKG